MTIYGVPDDVLFANTPGLVRTDHPHTSRAAAMSVPTGAARRRVYEAIRDSGPRGMTDEEVIDTTGMAPNTARPRRVELHRQGYIVLAGFTRPTRSGKRAQVWRAT